MALKEYKPTSSARRRMTVSDFAEMTKSKPEKKLTEAMRKTRRPQQPRPHHHPPPSAAATSGATASSTCEREKDGVPAKVAAIEYDPNRTARLALLHYADGEKRYILAPVGVNVGDTLISGEAADIRPGQRLPLKSHPAGHRGPQRGDAAGRRRRR